MKKSIIGGFYREWNREGLDSIPEQVKRMNIDIYYYYYYKGEKERKGKNIILAVYTMW